MTRSAPATTATFHRRRKSRIGDWEADTIVGANHKGAVMSHVERHSKYTTKLAKLPHKSADSVVQAYARVLLPLAD